MSLHRARSGAETRRTAVISARRGAKAIWHPRQRVQRNCIRPNGANARAVIQGPARGSSVASSATRLRPRRRTGGRSAQRDGADMRQPLSLPVWRARPGVALCRVNPGRSSCSRSRWIRCLHALAQVRPDRHHQVKQPALLRARQACERLGVHHGINRLHLTNHRSASVGQPK
jgi:hypothetical protein